MTRCKERGFAVVGFLCGRTTCVIHNKKQWAKGNTKTDVTYTSGRIGNAKDGSPTIDFSMNNINNDENMKRDMHVSSVLSLFIKISHAYYMIVLCE